MYIYSEIVKLYSPITCEMNLTIVAYYLEKNMHHIYTQFAQ